MLYNTVCEKLNIPKISVCKHRFVCMRRFSVSCDGCSAHKEVTEYPDITELNEFTRRVVLQTLVKEC